MTHDEWVKEARRRFGDDPMKWAFVCPSCGYVATLKDWHDAGASEKQAAFSCIGRYSGSKKHVFDKTGGPCNYAGGGLIGLNPVTVQFDNGKSCRVFAFAEGPNK
jgi:hypothetical protein